MKKKQLLCVLLTGLMLLVPYSGVLAEEPEIQTEELTLASGVEGEEAMISRFDRYVMTEGQEYELDLDGDGKTETISYKGHSPSQMKTMEPVRQRRRSTGTGSFFSVWRAASTAITGD